MKWVILAVIVLAVLVTTALVIGSRMSRDHVATVRGRYAASPSRLWEKISDPARAASWRSDVKRVEMLPPRDGRIAWRESSGTGDITYEMVEQKPMESQVSRITDETLPYGGQWEYRLTPDGSGTELTITERGFVKPALFRFLSRTVFSLTSTLEAYHRSLAATLDEPSRIISSTVEH